jgi:hypothetical protein
MAAIRSNLAAYFFRMYRDETLRDLQHWLEADDVAVSKRSGGELENGEFGPGSDGMPVPQGYSQLATRRQLITAQR